MQLSVKKTLGLFWHNTKAAVTIELMFILPFLVIMISGFWEYAHYQLTRALLDDTAYALVNVVKDNKRISLPQIQAVTNELLNNSGLDLTQLQIGYQLSSGAHGGITCPQFKGTLNNMNIVCMSYPIVAQEVFGMSFPAFRVYGFALSQDRI